MDTYAYMFGENLYINLTNRCCNDCTFCLRNDGDGVGEDNLWLSKEPKAHEVIAAVARFAPSSYRDVVFCGYGEPTYALDVMREVADYVHGIGKKTRLNTNGLGNVIQGKDIVPQLKGKIDTVSVSLNECSAEKYDAVCRPNFGGAYDALKIFVRDCVAAGIDTVVSVVDVIGAEDIEICRKTAAELGAKFRVRKMITPSL